MSPSEPQLSTLPPEGPAPKMGSTFSLRRAVLRGCSVLALVVSLALANSLVLSPGLEPSRAGSPNLSTLNSLKQLGMVFKMYANDSADHRWPALVPNERIWAPDLSKLYPEYLTDPDPLVAREHPDAEHIRATLRAVLDGPNPDYDTAAGLMALSFAYLGHAVKDEAGFLALVEARKQGLIGGSGENISLSPYADMVLPLREGIERFFVTDINGPAGVIEARLRSVIPVLVETAEWRNIMSRESFSGASVLYMDGHVLRVPLGTFPVVPSVMDALCGIVP